MDRRRLCALLLLVAAVLLAGCGSNSSSSSSQSSASSSGSASGSGATTTSTSAAGTSSSEPAMGFEGMPLERGPEMAPAGTTQTGTVDGISCGPIEQLAYHIHSHLMVYVNGIGRSLPAGVGIPGSQAVNTKEGPVAAGGQCIYWLHTHAPDGVIHVESPTARVYTLGDFFDEWHQPLSATEVAGAKGKVTAMVNGKPWTADPRSIPLVPHADIQLDVGSPVVAFQNFSWAGTQL